MRAARQAIPSGIQPKVFNRGAALSHVSATFVPASAKLRPLRDVIIAEPLDGTLSVIIHVIEEGYPARAVVKAIGPGCYPKRYDHPDKAKRTKMWDSKAFRPCDVKVGDTIEIGSFAFDAFYWGDKLHVICREEDVQGVHV